MNNKNIIQKIIRKTGKIIHLDRKHNSPELIRKKEARAIGEKLHLERNGYIFKCDTLKPHFYLPLYKNDYIQQRIITEKRYYEHDALNYVCFEWNDGIIYRNIKNGCILDIGANIGNHTLYFFFECGINQAYCFEPVLSTFNILQKNISINNLNNRTSLINAAIGAHEGFASVSHYDDANIGSTQISLNESGTIPVKSIDSMNIKSCINLIKIDVEGFEVGVIEGCLKTIERDKPYIMIEIQQENLDQIIGLLSKLGYQYHQLNIVNYLFYT